MQLWRLGTRGANGVSLIWVWRLQNQEYQCLKAGEMDVPVQTERKNSSFLHLFVLLGASVDWLMLTHVVRAIFFTQSTDLDASLFQKHTRRHPPNNVLPTTWVSLSLVKLTYQINHHNWFLLKKFRLFGNTGLVVTCGSGWLELSGSSSF